MEMDTKYVLAVWKLLLVAGLIFVERSGRLGEVSACDKQSCFRMEPPSENSSVSEVKLHLLCKANYSSASSCTPTSNTMRLVFMGDANIKGARALLLNEGSFDWAQSLEELHFDDIISLFFTRGAFRGLTNLRVLNMSGCTDVFYNQFLQAFQGYNVFSKLEVLILSAVGNDRDHFVLDNSFWKALAHTQLKYLDVSDMVIEKYNISDAMRYLQHLQFLNISGSEIINRSISNNQIVDHVHIPSLKTLDASRIFADKAKRQNRNFCHVPSIRNYDSVNINVSEIVLSKSLTTLILNNLCGDKNGRTFDNIRNLTFSGQSVLQRMYFRENHWPIVDIEAHLDAFKHVELIDLSRNGIEFLNDKMFSSLVGLKTFLLADNQLGKMAKIHIAMFTQLFVKYSNLSVLDLSQNNIEKIPRDLFVSNPLLAHIDLSRNRLTEVTFKCDHLQALQDLDLRGNMLTTLDIIIRAALDTLPKVTYFAISGNIFTCSACKDYDTIEWLIQNDHHLDVDNLKCRNENGNLVPVTQTVQKYIKDVCEKPLHTKIQIVVTVGILALCCVTGIASAYIIIRRRKHRMQNRKRLDTITKLENGLLDFLVFLLYSSKDADFVQTNVYPLLKQHLTRYVPIDKDVIALGDKDFKVGKMILNEIVRCTKSSAVVLLFLTDNFNSSEYCLQEFDIAFRVGKPVILMLKGDVDMIHAPPVIRDLFHSYVRVMWKQGDRGEYFLTTSWDNVCNAILESG